MMKSVAVTAAAPMGLRDYLDFGRKPAPQTIGVMAVGAVLALGGAAAVFWGLFTEGHAAFNTSSDMPWGLPIALYLSLLLCSSGLSVLASLDLIFGMRAFYPITKRCVWLAIVTLMTGFSVLALEIGDPFRMLWALPLGLQIKSPMWWMGVFYSLDLVLLLVKFWLLHTKQTETRFAHTVTLASFVTVICAAGTLGLVFGMVGMRAAWFNPLMPVYFIFTGFLSAIALAMFVVNLVGRYHAPETPEKTALYEHILPRLFFVILLGVIAMIVGRTITGLWTNYEGFEVYNLRFEGPIPLFYVELFVGLLVPLAMMSTNALRARPRIQLWAAAMVLVGILASRLDLLIIGQQVPLFKGSYFKGVSALTGFVEYWPSFTEWMLVPMGFGMMLFFYAAGHWLLRLNDMPEKPAAAG